MGVKSMHRRVNEAKNMRILVFFMLLMSAYAFLLASYSFVCRKLAKGIAFLIVSILLLLLIWCIVRSRGHYDARYGISLWALVMLSPSLVTGEFILAFCIKWIRQTERIKRQTKSILLAIVAVTVLAVSWGVMYMFGGVYP
jgi:protein-S-isoprenylcysteine O-methyltransferase Ste14